MNESNRANEFRDEAARLKLIPRAEQRRIIEMHRADAENPKVPKADREFARRRATALARLLKLGKPKGKKS